MKWCTKNCTAVASGGCQQLLEHPALNKHLTSISGKCLVVGVVPQRERDGYSMIDEVSAANQMNSNLKCSPYYILHLLHKYSCYILLALCGKRFLALAVHCNSKSCTIYNRNIYYFYYFANRSNDALHPKFIAGL